MPDYGHKIINIYPYDVAIYIQELVNDDQGLYESSGLHRNSTVRQMELETGNIQQS